VTGRICKALSGFYYVDTPEAVLACRARGKFRRNGVAPLVGDRVECTALGGGEGVLERVLPRRNAFDRPAVANIDQLVIVATEAIPRTEPYLIDRMTAIAALKDCSVLVCINKCDLADGRELAEYYTHAGFPVCRVSAATGEGMETLRNALSYKQNAFTGNSGVGKSSILNALDPTLALRVGEVSRALGRGKHTTRHVELFRLANDAALIDTPGFSSFDVDTLSLALKQRLPETFPDFAPYRDGCRFVGCSHTREKGCAVLEAVRAGQIVRGRHESYLRLYEELKDLKEWKT